MMASAVQVGPGRWAARLHANGSCIYNNSAHSSEESALLDAQAEIGRRRAAVEEARQLSQIEQARAHALPLLRRLVHSYGSEMTRLLEEARSLVDGLPEAAE